jgi:hypothetical protein
VVATILSFETAPSDDVLDWFEGTLAPALTRRGAKLQAWFVTEASPNTFPALPVREGEQVLVWFSLFPNQTAYDEYIIAFAQSQQEHDRLWAPVARRLKAAPQIARLVPTARSLLHGE